MGFLIFFPEKPPILKLEVGFVSGKKSFSQIFENTAHLFYLEFISKKTPKKSENIFWSPKPPIFQLKLDFFPLQKSFQRFTKIRHIFSILTLFLKKLPKNQRTFYDREGGR